MSDRKSLLILLSQRSWQALSGLISLILITKFLSPTEQGWYYTFSSFAALYTLFDFGLSTTLIQISSHLFAKVQWGSNGLPNGKSSKNIICFMRQSTHVYFKISMLFLIVILPLGILLFRSRSYSISPSNEFWLPSWIFLALATSLNFMTLPFTSILEGSGRTKEIFSLRLINNVIGSIGCWILLILGFNLFAVASMSITSAIVTFYWLISSQKELISSSLKKIDKVFNWKTEVWPMQWRLGITSTTWYLSSQIYVPILFYFQGATIAGQMGVTLTVVNMIGVLAQSWINHQIPEMGKAVALKNWDFFENLFFHNFFKSIAFYIVSVSMLIGVYLIFLPNDLKGRFLPFNGILGICVIVFFNHLIWAITCQLRSFKKEPFVWITISSLFMTSPLAIFSAYKYSTNEVILSILVIQILFTVPLTINSWRQDNKKLRFTNHA
jgi:O-antigen/teichoic acid export membrane protein